MGARRLQILAILATATLLLGLVGLHQSDPASAAPVVCESDGPTTFIVATEAELNQAIECFNAGTAGPGFYVVVLQNNIASRGPSPGSFASFSAIEQPSTDFRLTIAGAGLVATQSVGATAVQQPLFEIGSVNAAEVVFDTITLELLPGMVGVRNRGASQVMLNNSTLRPVVGSGSQIGVIVDGRGGFDLRNSIVGPLGVGIQVIEGPLAIESSTFGGPARLTNIIDIDHYAVDPVVITNSTFEGSTGIRVVASSGVVSIRSSTLSRFGISVVDQSSPPTVAVVSSIVHACSAGVIDLGFNIGGCFDAQAEDVPSGARDNGCVVRASTGCVPTIAIAAGSPPVGAGSCVGVIVDQRGEPRTPLGAGCDAGAYELPGFVPTPTPPVPTPTPAPTGEPVIPTAAPPEGPGPIDNRPTEAPPIYGFGTTPDVRLPEPESPAVPAPPLAATTDPASTSDPVDETTPPEAMADSATTSAASPESVSPPDAGAQDEVAAPTATAPANATTPTDVAAAPAAPASGATNSADLAHTGNNDGPVIGLGISFIAMGCACLGTRRRIRRWVR